MSDSSSVFRRCIHPLEPNTFFSDYWEQKPLIISRTQPGYFSDLLSLDAVDKILTSTNLRVPGFRLVQQGSQIPTREYTSRVSMTPSAFDELIDVDKVYALYQQGATIVLQALERSWEPLIEFCKGLEAYLGHPVQANMYLTPANAQGFAAHHDTHDTLILQVEGQKHWKVYDMPFPTPLPSQSTLPPGVERGEVVHDFVLNAGDTLYMPRGYIHEALTSDSHSMHITIGIKVWTWFDALTRVVNRALDECKQDQRFRQSLPRHFAEEADTALADRLTPLLDRFEQHLRADGIAALLSESFVSSRWAYRRGQLLDLSRLDTVNVNTTVCRRANTIVRTNGTQDGIELAFQGKWITFPSHAAEAVNYVSQHDRFRVDDLPDLLDDASKVVLIKRLIREGLLTFSEESGVG